MLRSKLITMYKLIYSDVASFKLVQDKYLYPVPIHLSSTTTL